MIKIEIDLSKPNACYKFPSFWILHFWVWYFKIDISLVSMMPVIAFMVQPYIASTEYSFLPGDDDGLLYIYGCMVPYTIGMLNVEID